MPVCIYVCVFVSIYIYVCVRAPCVYMCMRVCAPVRARYWHLSDYCVSLRHAWRPRLIWYLLLNLRNYAVRCVTECPQKYNQRLEIRTFIWCQIQTLGRCLFSGRMFSLGILETRFECNARWVVWLTISLNIRPCNGVRTAVLKPSTCVCLARDDLCSHYCWTKTGLELSAAAGCEDGEMEK